MNGPSKTDLNANAEVLPGTSPHDRHLTGVTLYLLPIPCKIRTKSRQENSKAPMIILAPSTHHLQISAGYQTLDLTEDAFLTLLLNPLYLKAPGKPVELSGSGYSEDRFFPIPNERAVDNFRYLFSLAAAGGSTASEMLDREMALLSLIIKMKNLPSMNELSLSASNKERPGVWSIEDLADHIQNHFDHPLCLDEMASRCALNASYLSRSFKEKTGTTIFSYLNQIRIEKACLLLKSSDLSITEIAFSVGYNNLSFFNRMFKRAMAKTPGEYRNSIRS